MYPLHHKTVLDCKNISKVFGEHTALNNVSFSIDKGQVLGLIGPNGAGKTTLLMTILGLVKPTSGTIHFFGEKVDDGHRKTREQYLMNFAAPHAQLPGNLTVLQNLEIFARLYSVSEPKKRAKELLSSIKMEHKAAALTGALSSGEHMKICIAKALINRPQLLLLDEPTASLDPLTSRFIRKFIKSQVRENHTALLWTSHNMAEVETMCDRVIFMARGKIMFSGEPKALMVSHKKNSLEDIFISSFENYPLS